MPYYKRDEHTIYWGISVNGPDGLYLTEDAHAKYVYPVDGWWWFANLDDAIIHFADQIKADPALFKAVEKTEDKNG
jgi:hypothetical protein